MKFDIAMTQEEKRILNAMLERMTRESYAGYPPEDGLKFAEMLSSWYQYINQIEQGYVFTIYDYTNDLSTRDCLQEILDITPASLQAKILEVLEPMDDRFRNLTREVEKPLYSPDGPKEKYWWVYRIPKKLFGELKKDLVAEGHIPAQEMTLHDFFLDWLQASIGKLENDMEQIKLVPSIIHQLQIRKAFNKMVEAISFTSKDDPVWDLIKRAERALEKKHITETLWELEYIRDELYALMMKSVSDK